MHTKSAVSRRDPGIKTLANSFNRQVQTMKQLKATIPRYRMEAIPATIDLKRMFAVDVFSQLWDDRGLIAGEGGVDRWKVDQDVKEGIRLVLELDRCREERERLDLEVSRLAAWAMSMATRLKVISDSLGMYCLFSLSSDASQPP